MHICYSDNTYKFLRSQIKCVIVSSVKANSDGGTEITFFGISSDGTGLIPVKALNNAVKVNMCTVIKTVG